MQFLYIRMVRALRKIKGGDTNGTLVLVKNNN